MRSNVKPAVLLVLAGAAIALSTLPATPSASAQEYGESVGNLTVGYILRVSGDGFSPNSEVRIELVKNDAGGSTPLGAIAVDPGGTLAASLTLPDGLEPGTYLLTATGVTAEGLTRVLSTELQSPFSGTPPVSNTPSDWQLALTVGLPVLALALAGGGWWRLAVARKRRNAERAGFEGRADHRLFPDDQPTATQDRPVLRRDPHLAHLAAQVDWIPRLEDIDSVAQPGRTEQENRP